MTKKQAVEQLTKVMEKANPQAWDSSDHLEFKKWGTDVEFVLANVFGEESKQLSKFRDISYNHPLTWDDVPPEGYVEAFRRGLTEAKNLLQSMIEDVQRSWPDDETSGASRTTSDGPALPANRKVFVVHGHDKAAKLAVKDLLEKLELEPIILDEQPGAGRTLIEKFEGHSDVGFAVVILTPDDKGCKISDFPKEARSRARQNVILELDFFLGKRGRSRVCALYNEDVEWPSDYSGVQYVPYDEGGAWQIGLARELREAGFSIDTKKVL